MFRRNRPGTILLTLLALASLLASATLPCPPDPAAKEAWAVAQAEPAAGAPSSYFTVLCRCHLGDGPQAAGVATSPGWALLSATFSVSSQPGFLAVFAPGGAIPAAYPDPIETVPLFS